MYDVSVERVTKVCHYLRRYLDWVQNSVFEGELTISQLKQVEAGLDKLIEPKSDSVQLYLFRNQSAVKKKTIGIKKAEPSTVI